MDQEKLINSTGVYCTICRQEHQGRIVRQGDTIWGAIDCPSNPRRVLLSTHGDLFQLIRSRSYLSDSSFLKDMPKYQDRRFIAANFLNLSNQCDLKCPICFADSGHGPKNYIAMEDFKQRLLRLKSQGISILEFFGGEPSGHPQLAKLTSMARKMGFKPAIVTNGLKISQEKDFLPKLKKAGLKGVHLQFDGLSEASLRVIRGSEDLSWKLRAIERTINAGLDLALIVTVIPENLPELPEILDFALSLGPRLKYITFQGATQRGRFDVKDSQNRKVVTREEMLMNLGRRANPMGLEPEDFYPFPGCLPAGLRVHPDCMVFTALYRLGKRHYSLPDLVNLPRLFRIWQGCRGKKKRLPLLRSIGCLKLPAFFLALPLLFSRILPYKVQVSSSGAERRNSMAAILVESLANTDFQDLAKTESCPSIQTLEEGEVCACVYHSRGQDHPLSRISQDLKGKI